MRILLIEDDKDLCDGVALQLREEDYQVDCCYSGEDGLYYALHTAYDVIILDRMLPVMDGLTLLQTIRKNELSTPVLMVTAMGGINDRVDGLDAGADDYLVKPFAMKELLARIRALILILFATHRKLCRVSRSYLASGDRTLAWRMAISTTIFISCAGVSNSPAAKLRLRRSMERAIVWKTRRL